jgi:hypothetical protein
MTTLAQAKRRVDRIFKKYVAGVPTSSLIPPKAIAGKLYEAVVLGYVAENLVRRERLQLNLVGGSKLHLKTSPGPINVAYPHIGISRSGTHVANLFTDIEFTTLSCQQTGNPAACGPGDCHELDLAIVNASANGRPLSREIWLAVECKHTVYKKSLLRESLGIRRELSLLAPHNRTRFQHWPQPSVPAYPPACLMVCCSDPNAHAYSAPGAMFGIEFHHVPI